MLIYAISTYLHAIKKERSRKLTKISQVKIIFYEKAKQNDR